MPSEINRSDEAKAKRAEAVRFAEGDAAVGGRTHSPFMKALSQKYIDGEITIPEAIEMAKNHHMRVQEEQGPPF